MEEKIKAFLKFISSYKTLFILWLTLGVATLIIGNISRITYFCVWILLLLEYLFKALDEK